MADCRFSATVQEVLQELCFLECIGSTFLICLLEYYCITVRFFSFSI